MSTLQRLGATALTAALLTVPVLGTTVTADAAPARAGKSWTTIATWEGARQQACKVSIRDGAAWKIYGRLVNGRQAKIGAGMNVRRGDDVTSTWSSPLVAKGKTSDVGAVILPRRPGFVFEAFQFSAQAGTGAEVAVQKIGRC